MGQKRVERTNDFSLSLSLFLSIYTHHPELWLVSLVCLLTFTFQGTTFVLTTHLHFNWHLKCNLYLVNYWCIHHPKEGGRQLGRIEAACNLTVTWMPARIAKESLRQTLTITYMFTYAALYKNGRNIYILFLKQIICKWKETIRQRANQIQQPKCVMHGSRSH